MPPVRPSPSFGLTQDDFVIVYKTNITDGHSDYEYLAYIKPANYSTPIEIGAAWFPNVEISLAPAAESESRYGSTTTCGAIKAYEYYGTNGGGGVTTGTQLQLYNGSSWTPWTGSSGWGKALDAPYSFVQIDSYEAFEGWGS